MTLVNVSARNYSFTVAGLNCTTALKSADGGYSHHDQSGLLLISATFILGRAFGFTESLDDRTNPRWATGQKIQFFIDKSGGLELCPILGTLYILNSEYDGIKELKIEAGCILSLLNYRTPAGEGACFSLGASTSPDAIGLKLLQKVGIQGFNGSIGGASLSVPLQKLTNESYLGLFGKLCWVNHRVAYQDRNGAIQVKPSDPMLGVRRLVRQVGLNDVRYQRQAGAEKPCPIIRVSGTIQTTKVTEPDTYTDTEEYGPAAMVNPAGGLGRIIISQERTSESLNFTTRRKRTDRRKREPLGLQMPEQEGFVGKTSLFTSELAKEESFYEAASGKGCNEPDEGRLQKVETKLQKPYGVVFRDYLANNPDDVIAGLTNLVIASEEVTTYEYGEEPPVQGGAGSTIAASQSSKPILKVTTQLFQPIGSVLPDEEYVSGITALYITGQTVTTWSKVRAGEWLKREKEYKALALHSPESIERLEAAGVNVITLGTKMALIPIRDERAQSNSGGAQPPAPDRFPATHEITEKSINVKVDLPPVFGSEFRLREKEITIDGGLLTSEAQAREVGRIEGVYLYGRYKGQSCTVPLESELFSAAPLDKTTWHDPFNSILHHFAMDGLTIAVAQRRVVVQFDGVWLGSTPFAYTPDPAAPESSPIPVAPIEIPSDVIDQIFPPYRTVTTIEIASVRSLEVTVRDYSLVPQTTTIQLAKAGAINASASPLIQLLSSCPSMTALAAFGGTIIITQEFNIGEPPSLPALSPVIEIPTLSYLVTEDGQRIISEDGQPILLDDSQSMFATGTFEVGALEFAAGTPEMAGFQSFGGLVLVPQAIDGALSHLTPLSAESATFTVGTATIQGLLAELTALSADNATFTVEAITVQASLPELITLSAESATFDTGVVTIQGSLPELPLLSTDSATIGIGAVTVQSLLPEMTPLSAESATFDIGAVSIQGLLAELPALSADSATVDGGVVNIQGLLPEMVLLSAESATFTVEAVTIQASLAELTPLSVESVAFTIGSVTVEASLPEMTELITYPGLIDSESGEIFGGLPEMTALSAEGATIEYTYLSASAGQPLTTEGGDFIVL